MDFSIVVPTYNRPEELTGCLSSLAELDYSEGFEVIVVDDGGSTDLTPLVNASPISTRLLRQTNSGPAAARNAGARVAQGRWLAFTDDDCRPHRDWLAALRRALDTHPHVMVGGSVINRLTNNPYASASQLIHDGAYRFFNHQPTRGRFVASNNMALSRDTFFDAGGFDERFRYSEDREFCDRWTMRGGRIVWVQDAVVEHRHDLDFTEFLRQHYGYGRGAARFHRVRAQRGSGSLWSDIALRWHAWDLLLRPALQSRWPLRMLALLACWQAANTLGFARDWWNVPATEA